ncbi:ABC transporter substrate-binding protein [Citricoccus sp. GCM10030269]|uniref:ABC transporter substrate-binding protein n=1 Tax=Citricoccus sp. GCM10030269 TaxID=3273388 RepID=UPI0036148C52
MAGSTPHVIRTRRIAGATLALAALIGTQACAMDTQSAGSSASTDTIRIVLKEEPPTLETCQGSQNSTGLVTRANIAEGLTSRDADTGKLDPALATEWEQTTDTTWTFTLREGVTFHDGSEFDAEAAAYSIERALLPEMACDVAGQFFGDQELTTTVVDDSTLEVTTATPDPILPLRLAFVGIVPTTTDNTEKVREPIGTGPYQFTEWQSGTKISLERFDDYWGEAPDFASVEYLWRSEGSIRAAMVTNNEADVAITLAPEDGAGDAAVQYNTNEVTYMRMDAGIPPLDDRRVREAVNFALDKEGLLNSVFAGHGQLATQLVPEGVVGHNPDIEPWPFDMEKAKELIAEAKADGVPVDEKITIIGRSGFYPKADEAMEIVQNSLKEAGLNVEIQMGDVNTWLQHLLRPVPTDFGPRLLMGMHGNQAGDASFTMANNLGSEGSQSSYGTAELDELIAAAEVASGEEREELFAEALAYQNDEIVRDAMMVQVGAILALSPKVEYEPTTATGDEMRVADMHQATP